MWEAFITLIGVIIGALLTYLFTHIELISKAKGLLDNLDSEIGYNLQFIRRGRLTPHTSFPMTRITLDFILQTPEICRVIKPEVIDVLRPYDGLIGRMSVAWDELRRRFPRDSWVPLGCVENTWMICSLILEHCRNKLKEARQRQKYSNFTLMLPSEKIKDIEELKKDIYNLQYKDILQPLQEVCYYLKTFYPEEFS